MMPVVHRRTMWHCRYPDCRNPGLAKKLHKIKRKIGQRKRQQLNAIQSRAVKKARAECGAEDLERERAECATKVADTDQAKEHASARLATLLKNPVRLIHWNTQKRAECGFRFVQKHGIKDENGFLSCRPSSSTHLLIL